MSRTTERAFLLVALLICIGINWLPLASHTLVPATRVELARATPAPPCPCADLLQPVRITARRYRHPHEPTPLIMECQAPEVEAALPRTIDWPEPPLRDFRPQVDAHFDFSEPPAHVYVWHEPVPMPRYRPVHVPEPPMWPLMLAGLCGVLLFRRRQHC